MPPAPGLWHICLILMAVWFLIYGVSGVSARPVPNIGVVLGALALILGILLLILVAGVPLRT